ncbi:MAG: DNA-binding response regulator, partial [Pseudomonadales bacterium]|nr:DNA-binding response regulator [Pseudomonadales bacterium]
MPTTDTPTVYIVDDDEAVRFAVSMLMFSCGLRALAYESVAQFLAAKGDTAGNGCLVLDLNMPEHSGADLLELPGMLLPAVVITGFPDSPQAERAR